MRFLSDQDVYAATIRFVTGFGHNVVTAFQLGLSAATDAELLRTAHSQNRILLTRDRDFGQLIFAHGIGAGVTYLRILPSTVNAVHSELARVLALYDEQDLQRAFVVVEPKRHRIRRLTPPQQP